MLSAAMVVIGVAVVVESIAQGTGALAGRLLIGILMIAAGVGRGYIEVRRARGK